MKTLLFMAILLCSINICTAQNTVPCVINKDHIKISGKTITNIGNTHTYTVDFFYPNETGDPIQWLVFGGTIIAENTDPNAGSIYITVNWDGSNFNLSDVPTCIQNMPHYASIIGALPLTPIGVLAITQGVVFENTIYQGDVIPIMEVSSKGCIQYPETQNVNYLQQPCLISGVDECIFPNQGITHSYQWFESINAGPHTSIVGETQVDIQPPQLNTNNICYVREAQANGLTIFNAPGSCVNLNNFNGGQLYTDNNIVAFGERPVIIDEMPYGGQCTSNSYQHFWWVSYNDKPWELFSTDLHFPGITGGINKESVRIKRSTICSGVELFTNILEFSYSTASSYTNENQNYIKENTILVKGVDSWSASEVLQTGDKIQSATYYDGLARPLQKLVKEVGTPDANGVWKDVVTPIEYNALGQQVKSYLPFSTTNNIGQFKNNAIAEQANYYQTNYNETPAYKESFMELNPLNRPKQTKNAGSIWAASNGNQFEYDLNDVTENVKIWNIDFLSSSLPKVVGTYATNELFKTEVFDEKQNRVIEYTDKTGNVILKKVQIVATPSNSHLGWLCTYNVYDDLGQLRYTITPKAVEYMEANGWPATMPVNIAKDLCFGYYYDAKGRLTEKNTPQAGTIRYVYDTRDRAVLTQDENQNKAAVKKWSFVLYDELNREVVTGLFNSTATRDALQNQVNVLSLTNANVLVSLANGHNEQVLVYAGVQALGTNIQYNSINYYDNYNYSGAKQFATNHQIPASTNSNDDAIAITNRTYGVNTGSKVRVLDNTNTKYLINTIYYDEHGRLLQAHSENIKGGTDVLTNQYDFANKIIYTSSVHNVPNTAFNNFTVITKHDFDKIGRITTLSKRFNQNGNKLKALAEYSYDDLGRMKVKKLGPNPISGGDQVESLEYSYNLNGQLTGINKFYALKETVRYQKWDNFFGLYLGYDNKDNAFAKAELNGNITGAIWCTQGDDRQRKFDYDYDAANQFVKASFTQKDNATVGWLNTKFDFSVGSNHSSGNIQYDANGNILQMTQMGVLPNKNPFVMDDLQYTYATNSNKLTRVDDVSGNTSNGALQDFKDGTNPVGTGFDYDYDDNGNLVLDKNKGLQNGTANGITYNFLDKVEEVTIAGKGTVKYIYDASGEKLQKIFTPINVSATNPAKTTTFINEYVYQDDGLHYNNYANLQYIHFEEGRIRIISEVNAMPAKFIAGSVTLFNNGPKAVVDYFVTDHLGNTRMILTDELQTAEGLCTGEDANVANEAPQFGAVTLLGAPSPNNEYNYTRINMPPSWTAQYNPTTNNKCFGLKNITGKAVGPNVILKVMAGDVVDGFADYYYPTGATPNNSSLFTSLLYSVALSINASSVSSTVKGSGITSSSNTWGNQNLTQFLTNQPTAGNAPRAYLNILYFDELFNLVSWATPQRVTSNNMDYVQTTGEKCPVNGYAYVYLSNETDNMFVYFDNFKVTHTRGRIVEENHYYPFGLKIAAICSNKFGDPENGHLQNRFGYQGAFAEEDEYTGWNEFDLRNYDPQIGRWTAVDPYDEFSSGYIGMGNNPVSLTDPSGGFTGSGWLTVGAVAGLGAYLIANNNIQDDNKDRRHFQSALIGVGTALLVASSGWAIQETLLARNSSWDGSRSLFANYRSFFRGLVQNSSNISSSFDRFDYAANLPNFKFNLNITIPRYSWEIAEFLDVNTKIEFLQNRRNGDWIRRPNN